MNHLRGMFGGALCGAVADVLAVRPEDSDCILCHDAHRRQSVRWHRTLRKTSDRFVRPFRARKR